MFIDTITSGLTEPFRIGLIVALFATMIRTRAATGTLVPLAAGVLFVAVIIPVTMGTSGDAAVSMVQRVLAGIVSNIVILAVVAALWTLWVRLRR
jgi:hypothetical protein